MDKFGDGLLVANGHRWRRSRKLFSPIFHSKFVDTCAGRVNQAARKLIVNLERSYPDVAAVGCGGDGRSVGDVDGSKLDRQLDHHHDHQFVVDDIKDRLLLTAFGIVSGETI